MSSRQAIAGSDLLVIAGVAGAYFLAARFGLSLAFATQQVTAIWPPTGLALVALLRFGSRAGLGIYLGAWLANALANESLGVAAGIALGNTLTGFFGAALLQRVLDFEPALDRARDVLALLAVALTTPLFSASWGVNCLALGQIVPWSAFGSVWWVWWMGDALGILVFAPLLLTWTARPQVRWRGARLLEWVLLFLALAALATAVFARHLNRGGVPSQWEYGAFPFLIWAALRFGQREAVTAAVLTSGIAIWGAVQGLGPFSADALDARLIQLDTFIGVTSLTALLLGAVTAERLESQARLAAAHEELEQRVVERTAELAQANAELGRKNEEVEAFVYIVSHDLRAPLVNLQGFAKELELSCREVATELERTPLPAATQAVLKTLVEDGIYGSLKYIRASTTKFQRLIDALLTLSRSGREVLRLEPLDIRALVGTTLDSLRQSIEAAGAQVTVGPLPPARGDATGIGQVFSNLLTNGLAYLVPGRPGRLEVGGAREDDFNRYWVKDNGSGIPESARRRLFQVFQRFHPHLAGGEGMGLAIVKRMVERHGGRIWADSSEGEGTTFFFTLPAVLDEKE